MSKSDIMDGDRIAHPINGLGTVYRDPQAKGFVVSSRSASGSEPDMVFVVWDDERFPIGDIAACDVEKLSASALAMSSGF